MRSLVNVESSRQRSPDQRRMETARDSFPNPGNYLPICDFFDSYVNS